MNDYYKKALFENKKRITNQHIENVCDCLIFLEDEAYYGYTLDHNGAYEGEYGYRVVNLTYDQASQTLTARILNGDEINELIAKELKDDDQQP